MGWKMTSGWEEFRAQAQPIIEACDAILARFKWYYDVFEPGKPTQLYAVVEQADRKHSPAEEYPQIIEACKTHLLSLKKEEERLTRRLGPNEIKAIHTKRTQYKISEERYREILSEASKGRCASSVDLVYYEYMLARHLMAVGAGVARKKR